MDMAKKAMTYHYFTRAMAVDLVSQLQGTASTGRHIDRVFLCGLQVPVYMRVFRMRLDLGYCERTKATVSQTSHL
jgi:hypothetical protein